MPETGAADSTPPATNHTRTGTEDAHRAPQRDERSTDPVPDSAKYGAHHALTAEQFAEIEAMNTRFY
jgi:hypothetical protein